MKVEFKSVVMKKMILMSFEKNDVSQTKTYRRSIMKRAMLVAAMILGIAGMSFAQNSANTNVTVSTTVIQGITLTVSGTLNFGTVVAGTTPAALSANTNGSAPLFTATANGATSLTVTYGATVSLTGPGTALTFTPSVVGANSSSNQSSATSVASGSTVTTSGSTGSAGHYYFWLGGSLAAIPAAQAPGSYSGSFTLTVNY